MDRFIHKKINCKKYLWNYSKIIKDSDINETKYFIQITLLKEQIEL